MPNARVARVFDEHRRRINAALPTARLYLSGSASVDDLDADDVDVVVLVDDVQRAAERLRSLYPALHEDEWRNDWAAFRTTSSPQVDIVITRRGTKGDAHHRRAWDLLANDAQLRAEYRQLKAVRDNYAERKAAFFERVVALLPEAES